MKTIITGFISDYDIETLAARLADNLGMSIAPMFTTDLLYDSKSSKHVYYMSSEEVELSYKNDAFMWVRTYDDISTGVVLHDMYDHDLFVMGCAEFNNISAPVFSSFINEGGMIVFLDSKKKHTEYSAAEAKFALERIYDAKYLYFINETIENVEQTLTEYMNGDDEIRLSIQNELNT